MGLLDCAREQTSLGGSCCAGLLDCARDQTSLRGSCYAELLDRAREEAVSGELPLSGAA